MSATQILSPITGDMEDVDFVIRSYLNSEVVMIRTVGEYIIGSGGKRLRPALVVMIANALGYQSVNREFQDHHLLAATIEFIHTSTLLHDDVVDESDLRRGRETANAVFGNAASVLVGDYLYSRSFEMMVSIDRMEILQVLSQATTVIAEGEVLQLLNVHDPDVSVERYMQVVRYKTAKLFEASAEVGAIICDVSPELREAAASYGRHMGTAFQLIDDVLDYSGDAEALGKNVGDDLREGKPTLPLIHVMKEGSAEQAQLIRTAIETGEADFAEVARAIRETGALQYTRQVAEQESKLAIEAIVDFPDSIFKQSLLQLAKFAIDRDN